MNISRQNFRASFSLRILCLIAIVVWVTPIGASAQTGFNPANPGTIAGTIYITNTSSELGAQVNAAIAVLGANSQEGGIIDIGPGSYTETVPIAMSVSSVTLNCAGSANTNGVNRTNGATVINVAAATTGITITGQWNTVNNCHLISSSRGAGTDDGILVEGPNATLIGNTVEHFGRSGIRTTDALSNADSFFYLNDTIGSNYGDGFTWVGTSLQNGTVMNCYAKNNGGWGFNLANMDSDWFPNEQVNYNALGGVQIASSSSVRFDAPYFAAANPTQSSFVIASTSTSIQVNFMIYGQPTTITDKSTSSLIDFWFPGQGQAQNRLILGPPPGAANATAWREDSGTLANGEFALYDLTDNVTAFDCVPVTAACSFLAPLTAPSFISNVSTGTAPLVVTSRTPVANLTLSSNTQVPAINLAGTGNGGVTGQLPIGDVGSAGLSGTSPIVVSSTGAISCPTCTAITATAPLAISQNRVISIASPLPVANGGTAVSAPLAPFIIPPNMPISAMPSSTANTIYWHEFVVPAPGLTITHITFDVVTADSSSNDLYDVCVYSIQGTLEADIGATPGGTGNTFGSTGIKNIAIAQLGQSVTLPAGVYLVGFTGSATTAKIMGQYGDHGPFTAYGASSLPNASSNGQCISSVAVPSPTYTQIAYQGVPWVAFY